MKCNCELCDGTGSVSCPECAGTGYLDMGVVDVPPAKDHKHFAPLMELHKTAQKAKRDAAFLIVLKPEHQSSYEDQLRQTLERIEAETTEILKS